MPTDFAHLRSMSLGLVYIMSGTLMTANLATSSRIRPAIVPEKGATLERFIWSSWMLNRLTWRITLRIELSLGRKTGIWVIRNQGYPELPPASLSGYFGRSGLVSDRSSDCFANALSIFILYYIWGLAA